jgi:hypothetical protein
LTHHDYYSKIKTIALECQTESAKGVVIQLPEDGSDWGTQLEAIKTWVEILNSCFEQLHLFSLSKGLTIPVFFVRHKVAERFLTIRRAKSGISFTLLSYDLKSPLQEFLDLANKHAGRAVDVSSMADFETLSTDKKGEFDFAQSTDCCDAIVSLATRDSFPLCMAILQVIVILM